MLQHGSATFRFLLFAKNKIKWRKTEFNKKVISQILKLALKITFTQNFDLNICKKSTFAAQPNILQFLLSNVIISHYFISGK